MGQLTFRKLGMPVKTFIFVLPNTRTESAVQDTSLREVSVRENIRHAALKLVEYYFYCNMAKYNNISENYFCLNKPRFGQGMGQFRAEFLKIFLIKFLNVSMIDRKLS